MIYLGNLKHWDKFSRTILYSKMCYENIIINFIMNHIADPVHSVAR